MRSASASISHLLLKHGGAIRSRRFAYLADKTDRIRLATGITQVTARTPAMTAMSALTLHDLTHGRFVLGLGASGPQVVEGLHGVPYEKPLAPARNRRNLPLDLSGERVRYDGQVHQLPLPESEGKAIRIAHELVEIPIYLATLGPKSLEYTGKAANGWLGTSFSPDHPEAHMDSRPQAQPSWTQSSST